jgi:fumarate reductase flavoprotein subunit
MDAGAQLVNMDVTYGPELRFVPSSKRPFQQWLPASGLAARFMGAVATRLPNWMMRSMIKRLLVTWQHPENALFDDGAILLNRDGQSFVDETKYPDREIALASQPGKIAYILLDRRLTERYSAWPHFISTAPDIAYAYVADYLRLRPDVARRGTSLDEVAGRAGLDPVAVRSSVHTRNASLSEHDAKKVPLEEGPWVLLGPVKAYFTTTEGGAVVNDQMQVVGEDGMIVPGLYAVGQNGLSGMILWSHGLHIAWAMTSGRLAGIACMTARDR